MISKPYRQENDTLWLVKVEEPLNMRWDGSIDFIISQLNAKANHTVPELRHTVSIVTSTEYDHDVGDTTVFTLNYIRPATSDEIHAHINAQQISIAQAVEFQEAQKVRDLAELRRLKGLYPDE